MKLTEASKALLAHFVTNWHTKVGGTQAAPAVPYALDNRKLETSAPIFATVEVTNVGSDQKTMGKVGNRQFERLGRVDVRIYGPRSQGRGELDVIAEYVKELYEATRFGATPTFKGITTYATSIGEDRSNKEYPLHWCVLARTPFEYLQKR